MAVRLTDAERAHLAAILRDPLEVASWLDEMQYTACAAVLKFPQLAKTCTAHLFDSPGGFYIAVYRAVRSGATTPLCVFNELLRRGWHLGTAERLSALWWHPVTFLGGVRELGSIKKFIAWQYRQQKRAA